MGKTHYNVILTDFLLMKEWGENFECWPGIHWSSRVSFRLCKLIQFGPDVTLAIYFQNINRVSVRLQFSKRPSKQLVWQSSFHGWAHNLNLPSSKGQILPLGTTSNSKHILRSPSLLTDLSYLHIFFCSANQKCYLNLTFRGVIDGFSICNLIFGTVKKWKRISEIYLVIPASVQSWVNADLSVSWKEKTLTLINQGKIAKANFLNEGTLCQDCWWYLGDQQTREPLLKCAILRLTLWTISIYEFSVF